VAMGFFKVLSQHFAGGTEENHETSVRIFGLLVEIQARYPLNTSKCCATEPNLLSNIKYFKYIHYISRMSKSKNNHYSKVEYSTDTLFLSQGLAVCNIKWLHKYGVFSHCKQKKTETIQ
jgi:hypothetical protein